MRLKAKKPMVVVVEGLAASGGYIAALASDHIIAQQNSLVGSIGAAVPVSQLRRADEDGRRHKVEEVDRLAAGEGRAQRLQPTSPEARAALDALVKDSYAWFRGLVKGRRNMDDATLQTVADAQHLHGRQALGLKLVDQLGDRSRRGLAGGGKEDRRRPARSRI